MSTQKDKDDLDRRIDEALKETFPASDAPSFVGAGAGPKDACVIKDDLSLEQPTDKRI